MPTGSTEEPSLSSQKPVMEGLSSVPAGRRRNRDPRAQRAACVCSVRSYLLLRGSQRTLFAVGREALCAHRHTRTAPRAFALMKPVPLLHWTQSPLLFPTPAPPLRLDNCSRTFPAVFLPPCAASFPASPWLSIHTRRYFFVLKINLS